VITSTVINNNLKSIKSAITLSFIKFEYPKINCKHMKEKEPGNKKEKYKIW